MVQRSLVSVSSRTYSTAQTSSRFHSRAISTPTDEQNRMQSRWCRHTTNGTFTRSILGIIQRHTTTLVSALATKLLLFEFGPHGVCAGRYAGRNAAGKGQLIRHTERHLNRHTRTQFTTEASGAGTTVSTDAIRPFDYQPGQTHAFFGDGFVWSRLPPPDQSILARPYSTVDSQVDFLFPIRLYARRPTCSSGTLYTDKSFSET